MQIKACRPAGFRGTPVRTSITQSDEATPVKHLLGAAPFQRDARLIRAAVQNGELVVRNLFLASYLPPQVI